MPASVRVAGVHVDVSANATPYEAGMRRAQLANRQLGVSIGALGPTLDRYRNSITSSLLATAAYATGVGLVSQAVFGTVRNFLEFEKGLISVRKTAGLSTDEMLRLGEGVRQLTTETSALGRPLPVLRQDLVDIAVVAGQMNIRGTPDILAFTEAVGLLGLTTDLVGEDAANAFGKIIATTTATASESLKLGSAITALGNRFRGGESEIIAVARVLATQTAAFRLSAQDVLGYSAALSQGGQQAETSATAFGRLLQVLTDSAAEAAVGNFTKLGVIVQQLPDGVLTVEERVRRLQRTIETGDYTSAINQFLEALRAAGPAGSGTILTTLFGGNVPPARIARIFGFLATNLPEVYRGLRIANEEWEKQIALLEEAGQFAEARALRLLVAGNKLTDQGLAVGRVLSDAYLGIAENLEEVEIAAGGAAAALLAGFGRRRLQTIRETARATRTAARSEVLSAKEAVNAARARDVSARASLASTQTLTEARIAGERRLRDANVLAANAERQRDIANRQFLGNLTRTEREAVRLQQQRAVRAVDAARVEQAAAREQLRGAAAIGTARAKAEQRVARSSQQLARAQERLAVASAAATRNLTLGARAANLARGAYSLMGGPLGIVIGLLTVGSIAWSSFTKRTNEADDAAQSITATLEALERQQERIASGTDTDRGRQVQELRENLLTLRRFQRELLEAPLDRAVARQTNPRIRREFERAQELLRQGSTDFGADLEARLRQSGLGPGIDQVRELEETINGYIERATRAGISSQELGEGAAQGTAQAIAHFRRLNTEIGLIAIRVRAFQENLRDATRAASEEARFELQIVADAPTEQIFQRLLSERNRALQTEIRLRERSARDESDTVDVARRNLEIAKERVRILQEQNQSGSEALSQAQQQETRLAKSLVAAEDRLDAALRQLGISRDQLMVDEADLQALRELAVVQRELALARELARRPQREIPDATAQQRAVEDEIEALQRRLREQQRSAQQAAQIAAADARSALGLRARFEVENQYADLVAENARKLEVAQRTRADALARENILLGSLRFARDKDRDAIVAAIQAAREAANQAASDIESIETLIGLLEREEGAWDAVAEARQRLAEATYRGPLLTLIDDTEKLGIALENVTINALQSFEQELARVVETGKLEIDDLLTAIGVDLVQAFVRATVTADLAKLAFSAFGGVFAGLGNQALTGQQGTDIRRDSLLTQIRDAIRAGGLRQQQQQPAPGASPAAFRPRDDGFGFRLAGFPSLPGGTRGSTLEGGGHALVVPGVGLLLDEQGLRRLSAEELFRFTGRMRTPLGDFDVPDRFTITPDELRQGRRLLREQQELLRRQNRIWESSGTDTLGRSLPLDRRWEHFLNNLDANNLPRPEPIAALRDGPRLGIQEYQEILGIPDPETRRRALELFLQDLRGDITASQRAPFGDEVIDRDDPRALTAEAARAIREGRFEDQDRIQQQLNDSAARFRADLEQSQAEWLRGLHERGLSDEDVARGQRELAEAMERLRQQFPDATPGVPPGEPLALQRRRALREADQQARGRFGYVDFDARDREFERLIREFQERQRMLLRRDNLTQADFGPQLASFRTPGINPAGELQDTFGSRGIMGEVMQQSQDALFETYGLGGVMGRVTDESGNLLEDLFSQRGFFGQLVAGAKGLLSNLFDFFGSNLSSVLSDVLGSIGGAGGGIGGLLSFFGLFHEGGIAAHPGRLRAVRAAAARAALGPRERLIIALDDEEILTRRDPRHRWNRGLYSGQQIARYMAGLPRYHEGGIVGNGAGPGGAGGGGGFPLREVRVINQGSGPPQRVATDGVRYSMRDATLVVILEDFNRNGPISQGVQQIARQTR